MDIKPVTVLKSSQPLLVEEFLEKLKDEASRDSPELLFETRYLDDTPLREILEEAKTLPMFHKEKLVAVKGYDGLGKNDLDLLKSYAAAPPSFSRIVFISQGSRKGGLKPAENIKLVDLDSGSSIDRETGRVARELGMELTPRALGFVKAMLGEDMNLIKNELEKISLYVKGKKVIDETDIRGLMEKRSAENVFSLSTALSDRDLRGSLRILSELERNREDALSILHMIAWRFRQIFKVSQLVREGKSDGEMSKVLKTSRGAVFHVKKSAANFRENEMGRILALIEETDYAIKSGAEDKYVPLGKLVVGICGKKQGVSDSPRPRANFTQA